MAYVVKEKCLIPNIINEKIGGKNERFFTDMSGRYGETWLG